MISLETPGTLVWAGLLPIILIAIACIPVFWPGHDYGLAIIIAAVITGVSIESALKARKNA